VNQTNGAPSVPTDPRHKGEPAVSTGSQLPSVTGKPAGNSVLAAIVGAGLSIVFYGFVLLAPLPILRRYFLGHPVAVAATCLFCFALGVLIAKVLGMVARRTQLTTIRDRDLLPPAGTDTPAGRWLQQHDAGHVAQAWLKSLAQLPLATRNSQLVCRLTELLHRQSRRGTTRQLADDMRELATRDADAIHDSYGFVRIVVWAIPMLGFLGTVIGITQTLGGLDFSNGTAAVDSLKTGLYVAFDTTALGLVLSVIAIFIQFPIESNEQRLLAEIDARIGDLVSASLPSDEATDNQTALIADLCRGVQVAVAESLDQQARIWRETIDEARGQWQSIHQQHDNHFAAALEQTLLPALTEHAAAINSAAQFASQRLDQQWQRCQDSIHFHADTLSTQQLELSAQFESLCEAHRRAGSVFALHRALDANLQKLTETNHAIGESVAASAAGGMSNAMLTLARAVEVLSTNLHESPTKPLVAPRRSMLDEDSVLSRRAA
jgi:biopolymer transport protein ExbB/TolQ